MSQPTTEAAVAHVARCLRLNPMWQADEVLASRAALHGVDVVKHNPYQAAIDESARKVALRNKVYKLRYQIWNEPADQLAKKLDRLRLEGEPELAKLADRLLVIVEARAKLPQLTQHRDFDGDFFECFKQVLTGSVRQSAEMRERVAASFKDHKLAKRGVRMIRLLQREAGELFELESEWLADLTRRHSGFLRGVQYVMTYDFSVYYWRPHWMVTLLLCFSSPVGPLIWLLVSVAVCRKKIKESGRS
jgi:hypothetical protein